jgi:uncharacterized membrane protein YciS (DUF1049 family)
MRRIFILELHTGRREDIGVGFNYLVAQSSTIVMYFVLGVAVKCEYLNDFQYILDMNIDISFIIAPCYMLDVSFYWGKGYTL